MDHCYPSRNAAISVFGVSKVIISCWVHVMRKCQDNKKRNLLINKLYCKIILDHIRIMHLSSSQNQFLRLSHYCVQEWRQQGEIADSNWFQTTYLHNDWMNWFIGAPGKFLVNVENNSLESYNRQVKLVLETTRLQSLENFIDKGIQAILRDGSNRAEKSLSSKAYLNQSQMIMIKELPIPID